MRSLSELRFVSATVEISERLQYEQIVPMLAPLFGEYLRICTDGELHTPKLESERAH